MKKILLTIAFIFLFVTSVFALEAGQQNTYNLAAGEVLTVAAPPGATGSVIRLSRLPGGGNAQSVTAIAGADLTFGPYTAVERFRIEVTAGTVTPTMAAYNPSSSVFITSGTIDGTTIGGTTPAAGTFTTAYATTFDTNVAAAGVTLAGSTLAADGTDADISITITPKGAGSVVADGVTLAGGTNTFSLTNGSASLDVAAGATADINANLTVGGASSINQDVTSSGSPTFTAVQATTFDTNVAAAGVTLAGITLSADGTDDNINIAITPKGTGEVDITKVDIDGGAIDGTAIGANSASTGAFTNVTASTLMTIPEKTPVNAVASSKLLSIGTAPVEAETVSIGGVSYKFRAVLGAGVKASATLTSDETEVVDGDTVTVNDITYRFKDTMAQANDVKRDGTTADTTLANLVAAINLSGTEGVEYYAGTSAATGVVAAAVSSHATVITADDVGFAGNLFPKAENSIHLDYDDEGAYFTGGIDAQAANDVLIGTVEESIDNLVLAVTAGAGEGTNYGTGTVVNSLATAVKASASTMTATNKIKGVIGDSTAIAETLADGSWAADATFLSGGVNGTVGVANEICADGSYIYHCITTNTIADTNWRRIGLDSAY
jgi:hypothetical protein